jgi:transcriptional regulator with XRE-family HTH domain
MLQVTRSVFLHSFDVLTQCLVDVQIAVGVTQIELAARLERPQSFISKIESGDRRLDVIEFLKITTALKVDPERIIRAVLSTLVDGQY